MTSRSSVTFAIPRLLAPLLMLFLALVGLLPRIARAQATASINGTVYDTSGAVVPDAAVVLHSKSTNLNRMVSTNSAGV